MDVQFAYTILYVEDVLKTLLFYREAFGLEQKFITPEKDYAELISGGTTIAFANTELGKSNFKKGFIPSRLENSPFGMEIAFTTSDVAKLMEKSILAGAILLERAVEKPWGQTVGYVRDINGFIIELCTPVNT